MDLSDVCVMLYALSFLTCESSVECGKINYAEAPFVSVWNSPSEVCDRRNIPLNLSYFDIVANTNDTFEGNDIVIFYEGKLGLYPRIEADGTYSNGGLPQLANVTKHLAQVAVDISRYIPDISFTGLAVIDWESWRPIFDRNGYNEGMKIYIRASESLVREAHPDWSQAMIENEARKEFENGARKFMQSTLKECRRLRPGGQWGFYGFPNCYNNHQGQKHCSNNTKEFNDRLSWLFQSSSSFFPSIYLGEAGTSEDKYDRVFGQLKESLRLKNAYGGPDLPIFAYTRYKYRDTGYFYKLADLNNTIRQVAQAGMNGVALWGSTASFRTTNDCMLVRDYIDKTLGPFIVNVTQNARKCSQELCNSHGRCADTDWKSKSEAGAEKRHFTDSLFNRLLKQVLKKILGALYTLYDNYWGTEERTYTAKAGNGAGHMTKQSSSYSCVCFKGWTGQYCERHK